MLTPPKPIITSLFVGDYLGSPELIHHACDLSFAGARVVMACRDLTRAESAADEIRQSTGNGNVVVRHLDLASLYSIRQFTKEFLETEERLDILINNAGEVICQSPHLSELTGCSVPPWFVFRSDDVSTMADRRWL